MSGSVETHAHSHEHANRTRHRDRLAAVASGAVALLALVTSLYGAYVMRQQVRAGVEPRLVWEASWTPGTEWTLTVSNRGVGTAEVKRLRVFVDGVTVPNWAAASQILFGRKYGAWVAKDLITTLAPGAERMSWQVTKGLAPKMVAERNRLAIEVCYCSTFGECWVIAGKGLYSDPPRPVPACTPDPVPFELLDEPALEEIAREGLRVDAGASKAKTP